MLLCASGFLLRLATTVWCLFERKYFCVPGLSLQIESTTVRSIANVALFVVSLLSFAPQFLLAHLSLAEHLADSSPTHSLTHTICTPPGLRDNFLRIGCFPSFPLSVVWNV